MTTSSINIDVTLNRDRIPEDIRWNASDSATENARQAKAMMLAFWDGAEKTALRIDLWTKEMPVNEMKRFYIDCIGGLAQSVLTATGDEPMANEINSLCEKLAMQVRKTEA